jgi:hypothetical protein
VKIVAIIGSRYDAWSDPGAVEDFIDGYLDGWDSSSSVISGESPGGGVDIWVRETCKRKGISFTPYPADWGRWGKSAGRIRNTTIVNAADEVVAIWNGRSNGTRDVIDKTLRAKKHLEVIFPL